MEAQTFFAPPERASRNEIEKSHRRLAKIPNVQMVIDALPYVAGVINPYRQLVLANRPLLEMMRMEDIEDALGQRPGEAAGCVHSGEMEAGCGCSRHCRYCGAVEAVLEAQRVRKKTSRECRLAIESGPTRESLDLLVTAAPFDVDGEDYFILSINDISDQKRRRAIESIFFHDVMNTATTMDMLVEFLQECRDDDELRQELQVLGRINERLIDEITAQRDLTAAENGELSLELSEVKPLPMLEELAAEFVRLDILAGKRLLVDTGTEGRALLTDARLLRRVVFNMLKNALEATPRGATVTAGLRENDAGVEFWVHNPTAMSQEERSQVFSRSFSTKGEYRGLGTYSMKLLGERYMRGRVSFESSEEHGTTFRASFPSIT